MRRLRIGVAIAMIGCASVALAVSSLSAPAPASSATPAPPSATTGPASGVGDTSVTLTGTVNPNAQDTTYYFRYGTTTNYGTQTSPADAGSGTGDVAVNHTIYGLTANTTYHYQLVTQNTAGTTYGTDQTLTTTGSRAVVLGHEGFVSPGWVVGVEIGCFHGTSTCAGHVTMSNNGTVIGQRDYSIPADSGGFQNMQLTTTGQQMLGQNSVFNLLPVSVTVTPSTGQPFSYTIHLARWVWH